MQERFRAAHLTCELDVFGCRILRWHLAVVASPEVSNIHFPRGKVRFTRSHNRPSLLKLQLLLFSGEIFIPSIISGDVSVKLCTPIGAFRNLELMN
jgi:hypothetical protein